LSSVPGKFDAKHAEEAFREAARLNLQDPLRAGSMIRLPPYGQVVMTGDIHGNHRNLEKLKKYAMLDRVAARHVILHELAHTDPLHPLDKDNSHEVMLEAAEYKCEFPDQVHFLQSNHELAQLTHYAIAKAGTAVVDRFDQAVTGAYGRAAAPKVLAAIDEFIASFAFAAAAPNRVWMSHSLPDVHDMDEFDVGVFGRVLTREELAENRTLFHLVWGRYHNQQHIDRLAQLLDADVFITGHQPQEMGFDFQFGRLIILASDHNHGSFLPFDLSRRYTADALIRNIRKFVAVA
jgi:hypothetical protein